MRGTIRSLQDQAKVQTMRQLLPGTPFLLDMVIHLVDVRDWARMHIAVMNDASTNGHRHLSFGMEATMKEQSRTMKEELSSLGLRPTMRVAVHS